VIDGPLLFDIAVRLANLTKNVRIVDNPLLMG